MDKNIKIRHIRDSINPDRVMTLVTRREDGKISYGVSVNKPTEWVVDADFSDYRAERRVPGDQFCRRKGVQIATGRLNCSRTRATVELPAEANPYRAVLQHIHETQTGAAKRIAGFELDHFEMLQEYAAVLRKAAEQIKSYPDMGEL